jgi:hypothetical protein
MKYTILSAVAALAVGTAATAHAQSTASAVHPADTGAVSVSALSQQGSVASLNALLADWDRAGFNTPTKPSQYRVYGRNGAAITGPEYNAMVELIRSAVTETRQGRDQAASLHTARAVGLLASIDPSAVTHAKG